MKSFIRRNRKQIITTGIVVAGGTVICIAVPKAAVLVGSGICLAIGFSIGKSISSKIEEIWLTSEYNLAKIAKEISL